MLDFLPAARPSPAAPPSPPPDRAWDALPGVRRLSSARAALARRLAGGRSIVLWPEHGADGMATLTWYLDDEAWPAPTDAGGAATLRLRGPYGMVELTDGPRWLRALTGIDLDLDDDWLTGAVLGALDGTPLAATATLERGAGMEPIADACVLRWVLHGGGHSVACRARADAATWCALLAQAGWQAATPPRAHLAALPVAADVVLARHTLPHDAARALRPGDIVVPDTPRFSCDGHGRLMLGAGTLAVGYRPPNHLDILNLEPGMELHDMSEGADAPHTEMELPAAAALDGNSMAGIPLTLDFLLGSVRLPLRRLEELAAGSVLELEQGSPADVAVVCGGRRLGRAEIVNVDGRLGLRIVAWSAAS